MLDFFKRIPIDPRVKKFVLPILLLIVLIGAGWYLSTSAGPTYDPSNPNSMANDPTMLSIGLFLRLVVVIGLIYLFFFFLRWWTGRKGIAQAKRLSIVESARIAQRQTLHLVRVDQREFLIGATDQTVNLLAELDVDLTEEEKERALNGSGVGFPDILKKNLENPIDVVDRQ